MITSLHATHSQKRSGGWRPGCARQDSLTEERRLIALGELCIPLSDRAGTTDYEVLSVTKHRGIVAASDYFNQPVASRDLAKYKVLHPGDFAYSTIHIDEGAI